jgi:hypothetical protein
MRQAVLFILFLLSPPAHAEEARIVLLSLASCCPDEAWPEAEKAAVQELQGFDFTVEVVDATAVSEKDRRIELLETAKSHDAVCALRIVKLTEGGGVDLWIIDRVTGKMVYRQIPLKVEQDPESASIVALRVVELLRASLLELELPDVTPQLAPPQPTMQVVARDRPVKPEGPVGLLTGVSVLASPGEDTGVQGAISWLIDYRPIPPIAVELEGLVSFASSDIRKGNLTATFDVAAARAWLLWFIRPTGVVRPVIGAGAGIIIPWSQGVMSGRAHKEYGLVAYAGGTFKLVFAVTRSFWIRASFATGAVAPRVKIFFNGTRVARFGLPLLEGQLLLEIRIP